MVHDEDFSGIWNRFFVWGTVCRLCQFKRRRYLLPPWHFPNLEKLLQYSKEHAVEILLVDEEAREQVREVKAKQVMVLCQGELVEQKEELPAIL